VGRGKKLTSLAASEPNMLIETLRSDLRKPKFAEVRR
jgi:hypothetical protein